MMKTRSVKNIPFAINNRLLTALPTEEFHRLVPHLEPSLLL